MIGNTIFLLIIQDNINTYSLIAFELVQWKAIKIHKKKYLPILNLKK